MQNASGKLVIDLGAIAANYQMLRDKVGQTVTVAAVVKANAYGLGIAEVAPALIAAGCTHFFVANIEEALELRALNTGITILILNGFYKSGADLYIQHTLTPVLGSFMEIEGYKALGAKHGRALPAYLHFNTSMNRLGLGTLETQELLENLSMLDGINIQCIMSHFACADDLASPMNYEQFQIFKAISKHFVSTQKPSVTLVEYLETTRTGLIWCARAWRSLASTQRRRPQTPCIKSSI